MAQRIEKGLEYIFLIFIIAIFSLIVNNYFGSHFSCLNFFTTKKNEDNEGVYLKYQKEVKELNIESKNIQSETYEPTKSVPILVYHGIVTDKPNNNEEVSVDTFKKQMFLLKKNGYRTVTMRDFYDFIKNNKQLPKKSFVLTFDDGRKDSYYPVDPILAALNYNAVMFVITNNLGKNSPYYLSNEELKKMVNSGRWEINSHGKNAHGYIEVDNNHNKGRYLSNKMWLAEGRIEADDEYKKRIRNDLLGSKDDIEKEFGIEVIGFALPAGDYGSRGSNFLHAKDIVLSALKDIYPLSFFQFRPDVDYGYFRTNFKDFLNNSFFFRRIKITKNISSNNLLKIMIASDNKKFPYFESFDNEENWINGWGEKEIKDNIFTVKSYPDEKSAGVYLDGTYLWKNYQFNASIILSKGNNYSLEAMTSNGKTFVGCNYSNNEIKMYKSTEGSVELLKRIKINNLDIESYNNVGIEAGKNYFCCNLNDRPILKSSYNYPFSSGGIAIKVFSKDEHDGAKIDIRSIFVDKIKK